MSATMTVPMARTPHPKSKVVTMTTPEHRIVEIKNLDPLTVLCALWNVQCETRRGDQTLSPDQVLSIFARFEALRGGDRVAELSLWDSEFLSQLFGVKVRVSASDDEGPILLDVHEFERVNGWDRAALAIQHLRDEKCWDTSGLSRRKSIAPVILLAFCVIFACGFVLSHLNAVVR